MLEANRTAPRSITYIDGADSERVVSFAELHERALGILHHLQRLGAKRGDKMIIFLADNEQFIDGFWAAVTGGIVPVPVAIGISEEHRHKLLRIARKLGAPFIYTDRKSLDRIGAFAEGVGEGATYASLRSRAFLVDELDDISRAGRLHRAAPEDTAFIQFSSGSTSEPKGVVLTHGNLMANIHGAIEAAGFNENDRTLSWMPLTHDMGLIGFHLFMVTARAQVHQMPTDLFVRRPLLWMSEAAKRGITLLCSPNFGYRHYLKVLGDRSVDDLDLSAVRIIFNGAEPISVDLCKEFLERLAPAKLARSAMHPVYGLAEASLAVTMPPLDARLHSASGLKSIALDRHRMGVGQRAELVPPDGKDAVELMAVGRAIPYCELRIAGDDDRELPEGTIGHIHIRGENVTRGYFENPEANAAARTADGWLRTGDLGLVHEGQLYISGRAKEIIFVNGQNYYPHDLESIAQRADGLELGKVVAAGVRPRDAQTDRLVIFVLHRTDMQEFLPIATQVARLVNEHTGLERIPKTTSGKIQRHLLEQALLDGEFDAELAELARLREAAQGPAAASRTEIEDRLQSICNAALEGKRVGIHDNLFEVGASSLKLIEIHEAIDRAWPGAVELTDLFDYPSIAELAQHLERKA
jgi:acyl-CoA synthetase (AMP-forming)/AMP-acid ligase II